MDVPWTMLSKEALRALLEEFVLREGTEYGERDVSLDDKVAAVRAQLEAGAAVVSYDADTETCTILPRVPSRSRR